MHIPEILGWPTSVGEAKLIQEEWRDRTVTSDELPEVHWVAGVDLGFEDDGKTTRAAVAVLSFPDLKLVETAIALCPTIFPYVPGFLSFREVPPILQALRQLTTTPDLILCDGQGLAHPRRFGLACHLGTLLDCPTIGVAKSRFIGTHDEPAPQRGSWTPLKDREETIGAVLRTRTKVKPLYVSIGHKICLETAIAYVLDCSPHYRLPETTRIADRLASNRI
ncbi:MAG: deoxyribonuclease V [Roseofilum sp. SBFL]|uniref:deoxyribonuclease V n=1 Tax=unclassified Roseofilum TaxID=2620099 RepID=UPI001B1CF218|nr:MULTISPECIES: deoxyribonuclease V [unclassified Roseofilum]MBP0014465.1 deoxyribonuclease V [Roseofilum sp. SID3]MBP0024892.1 deoxyribonuclease V [Roseofilum sp. SID2]MBP0038095.1 deoxyribonuclease V [Roseofilum sp. SID1]MBP0043013.1 deoxyribonuclease V [Roseofilum sp. SBFL]